MLICVFKKAHKITTFFAYMQEKVYLCTENEAEYIPICGFEHLVGVSFRFGYM